MCTNQHMNLLLFRKVSCCDASNTEGTTGWQKTSGQENKLCGSVWNEANSHRCHFVQMSLCVFSTASVCFFSDFLHRFPGSKVWLSLCGSGPYAVLTAAHVNDNLRKPFAWNITPFHQIFLCLSCQFPTPFHSLSGSILYCGAQMSSSDVICCDYLQTGCNGLRIPVKKKGWSKRSYKYTVFHIRTSCAENVGVYQRRHRLPRVAQSVTVDSSRRQLVCWQRRSWRWSVFPSNGFCFQGESWAGRRNFVPLIGIPPTYLRSYWNGFAVVARRSLIKAGDFQPGGRAASAQEETWAGSGFWRSGLVVWRRWEFGSESQAHSRRLCSPPFPPCGAVIPHKTQTTTTTTGQTFEFESVSRCADGLWPRFKSVVSLRNQ